MVVLTRFFEILTGFFIYSGPKKIKNNTILITLKNEAKDGIHHSTKSINKLIRKNLITVDMASPLVNDNDNVNDIIKSLIEVAELLYGEKDSLLEEGKQQTGV